MRLPPPAARPGGRHRPQRPQLPGLVTGPSRRDRRRDLPRLPFSASPSRSRRFWPACSSPRLSRRAHDVRAPKPRSCRGSCRDVRLPAVPHPVVANRNRWRRMVGAILDAIGTGVSGCDELAPRSRRVGRIVRRRTRGVGKPTPGAAETRAVKASLSWPVTLASGAVAFGAAALLLTWSAGATRAATVPREPLTIVPIWAAGARHRHRRFRRSHPRGASGERARAGARDRVRRRRHRSGVGGRHC